MGFFGRRDKIVDLTERYKSQQRQVEDIKREMAESKSSKDPMSLVSSGAFSIFGTGNPSATVQTVSSSTSDNLELGDAEERRKRLAKRLVDMTTKIEDLSNQIYHLQQRLDVIEKRMNINRS